MVPITAALLNNATYNLNEDVCEMDGVKLHQVSSCSRKKKRKC